MSRKISTLTAIAIPLFFAGEIHAESCSGLDWRSQADEAFACIGRMDSELEGLRTELGELMSAINALKATAHPIPEIPRIPKGAVVASESECKTLDGGWSTYTPATARVIVGAGDEFHPKHREWFMRLPTGGVTPRELKAYRAESGGGELEVTLTMPQMPSHSHDIIIWPRKYGGAKTLFDSKILDPSKEDTVRKTLDSGGGQAHNNMPPYIALYFCKKD